MSTDFACDSCYKNKTKCNRNTPTCDRCFRLQRVCTYNRFNNPTIRSRANKVKELEKQVAHLQKQLLAAKANQNPRSISPPSNAVSNQHSEIGFNLSYHSPNSTTPLHFNQQCGFPQQDVLTSNQFSNQQHQQQPVIYSCLPYTNNQPGWIFPDEVIEALLKSYFQTCNSWPTNVLHERSFLSSWKNQPQELVYALCARGSEYNTRYSNMLLGYGKQAGEIFFNHAKRLLDIDSVTFETIVTLIHLSAYAPRVGKTNTAWLYGNLSFGFCKLLNLYIDPDDLEVNMDQRWTLIEKEMRRRVWWSVHLFADHNSEKAKATVKKPLPDRVFQVLTPDIYSLDGALLSYASKNSDHTELDTLSQELSVFAETVLHFHDKTRTEVSRGSLYSEADTFYKQLMNWKANLPEWVHRITRSNVLKLNEITNPSKIMLFKTAELFHLILHCCVLAVYRFSLVDLCQGQVTEPGCQHFSETAAFQRSRASADAIVKYFSDAILPSDPELDHVNMVTITVIANTGIYLAAISRFGNNAEIQQDAFKSYEFINRICTELGNGRWKTCLGILSAMETVRTSQSSKECAKLVNKLMAGSLSPFDDQIKPITDQVHASAQPQYQYSESIITNYMAPSTTNLGIPYQNASISTAPHQYQSFQTNQNYFADNSGQILQQSIPTEPVFVPNIQQWSTNPVQNNELSRNYELSVTSSLPFNNQLFLPRDELPPSHTQLSLLNAALVDGGNYGYSQHVV